VSEVRYSIERGQVFYTHHYVGKRLLAEADAATFTPLIDPIQARTQQPDWHFAGKDRTSVWFMHTRIDDAAAASFRFFHGGQCRWGADDSHIFCLYVSERPRVKVVKAIAAGGLRFLDEPVGAYMRQYALTNQRVYFYGRWVRGADPVTFRNIPKDRLDEPPEPSGVYRDDRFAYYFGRKLEGIAPDDLLVFHPPTSMSRVYAIDRDGVYCVDATSRTKGRDVSGTPMTRLTHEEVRTEPRYQPVRDYLARRTDLTDYWFNRG
jgi:DKNYY family